MKTTLNKIVIIFLMMISLTSCSGSKSISGNWYLPERSEPQFSLYDDGTCQISGQYGTGKWSLINGNELHLINYYGEMQNVTVESVDSNKMVISNGSDRLELYRSPDAGKEQAGNESKQDSVIDANGETAANTDENAQTEIPSESVTEENTPAADTANDIQNTEKEENAITINEEYVAKGWYTYYMSYLNAINHGGDVSYLKHVSDERKESFTKNYEKYNKGYNFENVSFDVDKTDMKIKDLGNGKLEATCHARAVNVCTEIATGAVEDNNVILLAKLEFDSTTGDYVLTQQQGDSDYTFGKHEMIHCAD